MSNAAPPCPSHPASLETEPLEPPARSAGESEIAWLTRTLVVIMARISDCHRRLAAVRANLSRRAQVCWDDDRRLAAERLASRLKRRPGLIVAELCGTKHGCEWLIARWEELRRLADGPTGWNDDQNALANLLMGSDPKIWPATMPAWTGSASPAALADRELALLRRRHASLTKLDAEERADAIAGIEWEPDKVLAAIRREEAAAWKILHWARGLLAEHEADTPDPVVAPADPPRPPASKPAAPVAAAPAGPPNRPAAATSNSLQPPPLSPTRPSPVAAFVAGGPSAVANLVPRETTQRIRA